MIAGTCRCLTPPSALAHAEPKAEGFALDWNYCVSGSVPGREILRLQARSRRPFNAAGRLVAQRPSCRPTPNTQIPIAV
jgi:hypothetical protein